MRVKQERGARGSWTVSWKGDDVTYRTVHGRLQNSRGRASEYKCSGCEKVASQWAYDRLDIPKYCNIGDRKIPYSTDIERYIPMCRGCHVKMDRGQYGSGWKRKTHCKRGHEFTESNTYIRPDGERNCRECTNDRARKSRMSIKVFE